ncbi:hypothetical protein GCM10022419_134070 [Nonomuraea rosea]|uniref:Uncharacterized protein n=1 Tax=Nonomuraea rosea TaxID=638574 RepID=A0ABP7A6A5_9ACTN
MSDATDSPAGAGHAYTVPARPDGWPDLLGRRPLSAAERARLRAALQTAAPAVAAPDPSSGMCFLTITGLDRAADPARAMRLRGRIHAAVRTAAERRRTSYQSTEATITIGISGPDARHRRTTGRAERRKRLKSNHDERRLVGPPWAVSVSEMFDGMLRKRRWRARALLVMKREKRRIGEEVPCMV